MSKHVKITGVLPVEDVPVAEFLLCGVCRNIVVQVNKLCLQRVKLMTMKHCTLETKRTIFTELQGTTLTKEIHLMWSIWAQCSSRYTRTTSGSCSLSPLPASACTFVFGLSSVCSTTHTTPYNHSSTLTLLIILTTTLHPYHYCLIVFFFLLINYIYFGTAVSFPFFAIAYEPGYDKMEACPF